jgi:hypothetical protein
MISLSQYYEESLYPLQDGVLNIVKQCATPFYLTGGTAISRGYYNHRYSDDLDFFVTNDERYKDYADKIISELENFGFIIDKSKDFIKAPALTSLKVKRPDRDTLLKIDLVNDSVIHFGDIENTSVFYKTDNIRNILSNKLGALFRYAAKDVADIREISLHNKFSWTDLIAEALQKDAGVQLDLLAEVVKGMPEEKFNEINWVKNPTWEVFYRDIQTIAQDMVHARDNTLCG